MPISTNDTRVLLQRSRIIADNADLLSMALLRGEQGRIEEAVDDLAAAYDNYTGQAASYGSRLAFDRMDALTEPKERDQSAAKALAGALLDLEIAVVMGQFAQATGEIEGEASPDDLDSSVATFNQTLVAIEGLSGSATGATRFAFDEVTAVQTETVVSHDLPAAKANYERQVKSFYEALVTESTTVLSAAFKEITDFDAEKISEGLKNVVGMMEGVSGSKLAKLASRAWEALKRAVETLVGALGKDLYAKIEERINEILDGIRKASLQSFLEYAYRRHDGQTEITGWIKDSQVEMSALDDGARSLRDLRQRMAQAFALDKRVIENIRLLSRPLEWILKKVGGAAPLDLLMGGVILIVTDIALLQGMDYADTAKIITFVDGVVITSKRALGVN